jgi:hypothetical protein
VTDAERRSIIETSALKGHYEKAVDRESAYGFLKSRAAKNAEGDDAESAPAARGGRPREGVAEAMVKSAACTIGPRIGRQIIRGVLGSLLGGRR